MRSEVAIGDQVRKRMNSRTVRSGERTSRPRLIALDRPRASSPPARERPAGTGSQIRRRPSCRTSARCVSRCGRRGASNGTPCNSICSKPCRASSLASVEGEKYHRCSSRIMFQRLPINLAMTLSMFGTLAKKRPPRLQDRSDQGQILVDPRQMLEHIERREEVEGCGWAVGRAREGFPVSGHDFRSPDLADAWRSDLESRAVGIVE